MRPRGHLAAALLVGLVGAPDTVAARPVLPALDALLRRPALGSRTSRELSPRSRALVERIRRETGYLLDDVGPRPNSDDRQRWSDGEVRRMASVLTALPPRLRFLPAPGATASTERGYTLTRDSMNQEERALYQQVESSLVDRLQRARSEKVSLRARIGLVGQLALVRAVLKLKIGTVFGNAYYDRPEIRLYTELLHGSKLPGLRKMLAFTTVHEIGHQELQVDRELQRAWSQHFERGGREEFMGWCGYAAGSVHEGYGVGIGTFAVAPGLLKKKAPRTYQFFVERFGAEAFKPLRGGVTERLAIQLVYGLSDLAARLGAQ